MQKGGAGQESEVHGSDRCLYQGVNWFKTELLQKNTSNMDGWWRLVFFLLCRHPDKDLTGVFAFFEAFPFVCFLGEAIWATNRPRAIVKQSQLAEDVTSSADLCKLQTLSH